MTKVGVFLAKIVAIVNQKGGVGKTTTCVNLTSSLKEKGNRVLLCDFDPQANSTSGMGVDKAASRGVYDVLINGADVTASVAHTRYGDVLPSSKALAGAGIEMIDRENREFLLKQALDQLRLYPHRLPAVARTLNGQRPLRREFPDRSCAGRIFRARRPVRPDAHGAHGAPQPESRP